jgi:hypothetical protein
MSEDRIRPAEELYERAVFGGDRDAPALAERALDAVEAAVSPVERRKPASAGLPAATPGTKPSSPRSRIDSSKRSLASSVRPPASAAARWWAGGVGERETVAGRLGECVGAPEQRHRRGVVLGDDLVVRAGPEQRLALAAPVAEPAEELGRPLEQGEFGRVRVRAVGQELRVQDAAAGQREVRLRTGSWTGRRSWPSAQGRTASSAGSRRHAPRADRSACPRGPGRRGPVPRAHRPGR